MHQSILGLLIAGVMTSIVPAAASAAAVSKDLVTQGAIHEFGNLDTVADYYGSGPDDNFAEYGIAGFAFDAADFGGTVAAINSVTLSLTHNDRTFSDGDTVEFFFTPDTYISLGSYANLSFDSNVVNGIDPSQYASAPISLGTFPYTPEDGGTVEHFVLDFSGTAGDELLSAINNGSDFQIIIAATVATHDITFSGLNNSFDPGNPNLTIDARAVPVLPALPLMISALAGLISCRRRS